MENILSEKELEIIYDLARVYVFVEDSRPKFVKELKSLLLYSRMKYRNRILKAIEETK